MASWHAGLKRQKSSPDHVRESTISASRNLNRILTKAGDDAKAGEFFVVMTLQKGAAPPVEVKGLASMVTVGGQTVRFDGRKIIMGP